LRLEVDCWLHLFIHPHLLNNITSIQVEGRVKNKVDCYKQLFFTFHLLDNFEHNLQNLYCISVNIASSKIPVCARCGKKVLSQTN